MKKVIWTWLAVLLLGAMAVGAARAAAPEFVVPGAAQDWAYYRVGNSADAAATPTPGLLLFGGSSYDAQAFQWFAERAGGGDILVISATDDDYYNQLFWNLAPVDSVETIVFKARWPAQRQVVYNKLMQADALFITGGDQWKYLSYWQDTLVEQALHDLAARGVPIGGTSAGLAVLGEFVFSAENGTVYSDEALTDPYNMYMTLENDFLHLPGMWHIITDSHFYERDRMGRLVGFLARIRQDGWSTRALGIGVDESTAVLVEANGVATVVGAGYAYFVQAPGAPQQCQPGQPLTYLNVPVYRLEGGQGGTFSFVTWQGSGGVSYTFSVIDGAFSTNPY